MFSETLYALRKQHGLSQEALAEKLNVSRQSVSKWENGSSMPETEKLIAISELFGVSLDLLIGKESPCLEEKPTPSPPINQKLRILTGLVISSFGILGLIIWGMVTIFAPNASDRLGASSAVTIDGSGLLLIFCVLAVAVGAWLLLKQKRT